MSYQGGGQVRYVCQSQSVSVLEFKFNHVRSDAAILQMPHSPAFPAQALGNPLRLCVWVIELLGASGL